MENAESTKVLEEPVPLNTENADLVTSSEDAGDNSSIVVSEEGGIAPNASAAVQRLIQSIEVSDKKYAQISCEAISAFDKIAEGNPEAAPLAIDGINKTVEAASKTSIAKAKIWGLAFLGGIGTAACVAWQYFKDLNIEKRTECSSQDNGESPMGSNIEVFKQDDNSLNQTYCSC